jgi:F0F1-type ATP synthase assembly protein I
MQLLFAKHPVKLFDACLILHAEHTINASTFSAMVTASTLANPFASVSAAVGTLAGLVKNFVFDINLLYTEKDEPHPQVVLALGL